MSDKLLHSASPDDDPSDRALAWLAHLHSGVATESDWAAYRAWRARSPTNAAAAREAEALWAAVGEAYKGGDAKPVGMARRRHSRMATASLAALILVAILGFWITPDLDRLRADHRTGTGEIKRLTLPDDSQLVLDGATAVDVAYTPEKRRIDLHDGRVYARVAAAEARAFVVTTADVRMTALGTRFTVTRNGGRTSLAVEEHAVRVAFPDRPDEPTRTVPAGQRLVHSPEGGIRMESFDRANIAAWRRRMLVFNDRRLGAVIADLRRHTEGALVFADSDLSGLHVTGMIDLRDPKRAVDRIESLLPVRAYRLPWVTVLRANEEK